MVKKKVEKKDIIGWLGLIVTIIATILALTQVEVRCFLGLDDCTKKQETHQPVNPPDTTHKPGGNATDTTPASNKKDAKTTEMVTYEGSVVDSSSGNLLPGITVVCGSCVTKKTHTDQQGAFRLEQRFDAGDELRQVLLILSDGSRTKNVYVDWRERSNTTISF